MINFFNDISIWGDSVLKGIVLNSLNGNKYEILKNSVVSQCAKLLGINIQNNSRFGCTITKGNTNLMKALDKGLHCDAAIIEFGGNDCDFNWKEISSNPYIEHEPNTPLDIFKNTLNNMIILLRDRGIEPILMSLPPLEPEKYFNWIISSGLNADNIMKFIGNINYIYRFHERYSNAVTNIAMKTRSYYVDVRDAFLSYKHYEDLLCNDGIHPNEKGHEVMREVFVNEMANQYKDNERLL